MVRRAYVPSSGDIIWLDFDPRVGREQSGKRPAIVLSPKAYNELTGLALVCPVTSKVKGYPFEVKLAGNKIAGVILADHVKSVDWKESRAALVEAAEDDVVLDVVAKLNAILPKTPA